MFENMIFFQIFENKGAVMGCSNPHPHCQVSFEKRLLTILPCQKNMKNLNLL